MTESMTMSTLPPPMVVSPSNSSFAETSKASKDLFKGALEVPLSTKTSVEPISLVAKEAESEDELATPVKGESNKRNHNNQNSADDNNSSSSIGGDLPNTSDTQESEPAPEEKSMVVDTSDGEASLASAGPTNDQKDDEDERTTGEASQQHCNESSEAPGPEEVTHMSASATTIDIQEQRRQEQTASIQEGEKPSKMLEYLRKGAVATVGGTMVGLGLVMIPLPTPFGAIVASSGMAVLGTEFESAKEIMDTTKTHLETAREHVIRSIESMEDDVPDSSSSSDSSKAEEEDDDDVSQTSTTLSTASSTFMNPAERKRQEELAAALQQQQQAKKPGFLREWKKQSQSYLAKNLVPLLKKTRIDGEKDQSIPETTSMNNDTEASSRDILETLVAKEERATPRLQKLEDLYQSKGITGKDYASGRQRIFEQKMNAASVDHATEAPLEDCEALPPAPAEELPQTSNTTTTTSTATTATMTTAEETVQ